jgi:hypothetical protein
VEDPYNCIRKFGVRANHLDELVVLGTLTARPRPSWTRASWRASTSSWPVAPKPARPRS